jgi:predicted DNA binding CopG/RHH family protein
MSGINTDVEPKTETDNREDQNIVNIVQPEAIPVEHITEKKSRNHHLKVDNPKSQQITFRVTQSDFHKIQQAVSAQKRKQKNENYNVGNLVIDMINYMDVDLFATFKVK